MSYKWASVGLVLSMSFSAAALAQTGTNGAETGAVAVQYLQPVATDQPDAGGTLTPNAPLQPVPGDGPATGTDEPSTPNAPVQATPDEGPVPPGTEAGTTTASQWMAGPVVYAAIGAVVLGAAACLAACGGHSSTTSTTTTMPK